MARRPLSGVVSLRGEPLPVLELEPEERAEREQRLAEAQAAVDANPDDRDALVWLGRRTAYLGRYREAIEIFSRGVERFPDDARFLRHRGHRYLTVRELDAAAADLERAGWLVFRKPDEVEPDGLPNARGVPTSTLQGNIWYHLGLARYLRGDFAGAAATYRRALQLATNPDSKVAASYWLYLTLLRLGRGEEAAAVLAPIAAGMGVIENQVYHRLLLVFKAELAPETVLAESAGDGVESLDFATAGYGIGAWYLASGREKEALAMFRRVLRGGNWPAFGTLAAEAELARAAAR
jgi:tetratricopeptide (TPR) repeat protein